MSLHRRHEQSFILLVNDLIRYLGGVLLEGFDLCSSVLQNAVYCLVKYPDSLKLAREEVDSVVGRERMPTLEDVCKMPFLLAFIEEVSHRCKHRTLLIPRNRSTVIDLWRHLVYLTQ